MNTQKKILLVDDNDFILLMLEKYISEWPEYETVSAQNGVEALEVIEKENFDLIVTDILMPKKDGIELIQELREMGIDTPVIVISAGDDSGDQENYINFAGYFANETLPKPFAKDELKASIHRALSQENTDFLQYL